MDTDSDLVNSPQGAQATTEEVAEGVAQTNGFARSSELKTRTATAVDEISALIDSGDLDAAENRVSALDLSVYGYGQPEFDALSDKIAQLRLNPEALADNSTEADAGQDLAAPVSYTHLTLPTKA